MAQKTQILKNESGYIGLPDRVTEVTPIVFSLRFRHGTDWLSGFVLLIEAVVGRSLVWDIQVDGEHDIIIFHIGPQKNWARTLLGLGGLSDQALVEQLKEIHRIVVFIGP